MLDGTSTGRRCGSTISTRPERTTACCSAPKGGRLIPAYRLSLTSWEEAMRYAAMIMLAGTLSPFLADAIAAPDSVPPGGCRPVSERKSEVGCWVVADREIGELKNAKAFWHLETFPTREAAEAAKGPHGAVVEAYGKIWLLTIQDRADWRVTGGNHVSNIGPPPVMAGG